MRKRVVVTGLGAISPLGLNVEDTWSALLERKSGVAQITNFDASENKTKFAAEVKGFDAVALFGRREARRMDRYVQFALAASLQAVEDAGLIVTDENKDRIGVLIGTGIGGVMTLLEQADVMRERGASRVSPFLIPMMLADSGP
ncbi:MAG: beta-ketoacyl-[acyl-carrier-protein] synthase II, partial [Anaerolineaceae bacterium 4572_5.1]